MQAAKQTVPETPRSETQPAYAELSEWAREMDNRLPNSMKSLELAMSEIRQDVFPRMQGEANAQIAAMTGQIAQRFDDLEKRQHNLEEMRSSDPRRSGGTERASTAPDFKQQQSTFGAHPKDAFDQMPSARGARAGQFGGEPAMSRRTIRK